MLYEFICLKHAKCCAHLSFYKFNNIHNLEFKAGVLSLWIAVWGGGGESVFAPRTPRIHFSKSSALSAEFVFFSLIFVINKILVHFHRFRDYYSFCAINCSPLTKPRNTTLNMGLSWKFF